MRAGHFYKISTLGLTAILFAAGCVDESVDTEFATPADNDSIEQALESVADEMGFGADGTLGEVDDSDEQPFFGSAALADEFGGEDVGGAPVPEGSLADTHPGARIFTIAAVWGRIQRDGAVEPVEQRWDPTVTVTGGAVRVVRTMRFEPFDQLAPQVVPNEVAARSRTRPHVDGLLLEVAIAPENAADADFRFQSLPVQILVPAVELVDLNQTHRIDVAGNGVILVALERSVTEPCAHGFVAGRWARTRENGGVFGGQWQSETGEGEGFLAGRWGVNAAGERVFHGKVINQAGAFRGLLSGTWGEGAFRGQLFGADGNVTGALQGRTAGEDGHGLFRGAWQSSCD